MELTIDHIPIVDFDWLAKFVRGSWGSTQIVSRGKVYDIMKLPTLIAKNDKGESMGILSYLIADKECEIVVLKSLIENQGVGTALLNKVHLIAKEADCKRIWLITTNDNLNALKFYQKRDFQLVAVYRNALAESRKLKPQIPIIGIDRIPLRDEIELEMIL